MPLTDPVALGHTVEVREVVGDVESEVVAEGQWDTVVDTVLVMVACGSKGNGVHSGGLLQL